MLREDLASEARRPHEGAGLVGGRGRRGFVAGECRDRLSHARGSGPGYLGPYAFECC